jgi:hypothetical protein
MDCCCDLSCGDCWEFKGLLNVCSSKSECIWFVHIEPAPFYVLLLSQRYIFLLLSGFFFLKFHFNELVRCVSTSVFNLVHNEVLSWWRAKQLQRWSCLLWTPMAVRSLEGASWSGPELLAPVHGLSTDLKCSLSISFLFTAIVLRVLFFPSDIITLRTLHPTMQHIHSSSPSFSWS